MKNRIMELSTIFITIVHTIVKAFKFLFHWIFSGPENMFLAVVITVSGIEGMKAKFGFTAGTSIFLMAVVVIIVSALILFFSEKREKK